MVESQPGAHRGSHHIRALWGTVRDHPLYYTKEGDAIGRVWSPKRQKSLPNPVRGGSLTCGSPMLIQPPHTHQSPPLWSDSDNWRVYRRRILVEFLTTTGVSHHLEELIKQSNERLVLIGPFLRTNARIREFLEDKNRMKIDIRVVYGKKELAPEESSWLESMTSIGTSFYPNLHAKCYLSERVALLTSMNLYEFGLVIRPCAFSWDGWWRESC